MLTVEEARTWAANTLNSPGMSGEQVEVAYTVLGLTDQAEIDRRRIIALEVALARFVPGLLTASQSEGGAQ